MAWSHTSFFLNSLPILLSPQFSRRCPGHYTKTGHAWAPSNLIYLRAKYRVRVIVPFWELRWTFFTRCSFRAPPSLRTKIVSPSSSFPSLLKKPEVTLQLSLQRRSALSFSDIRWGCHVSFPSSGIESLPSFVDSFPGISYGQNMLTLF